MDTPKLLTTPAPVDEPIIIKIEGSYHIGYIDPIEDQVFTANVYDIFPVSKIEGWYPLPR